MKQSDDSFVSDAAPIAHELFKHHLKIKFIHMVVNEGEDNFNKAQAILRRYPDVAEFLIVEKYQLTDPGGRRFTQELSPFQYAYWAGDIRMCRMMLEYLSDENKLILSELCQQGVSFELLGEASVNAPVFDFKPLIRAYEHFISYSMQVFHSNEWINQTCQAQITKLFFSIGLEQARLPVSIAQEFCWSKTFNTLMEFKTFLKEPIEQEKRTTQISDIDNQCKDYWFRAAKPNSRLGHDIAIFKFRPIGVNVTRTCGKSGCHYSFSQLDLEAIHAIDEQRMNDRVELIQEMQGQDLHLKK